MQKLSKSVRLILSLALCIVLSFSMAGCVAGQKVGRSGGIFQGLAAEGVTYDCDGNPSISAKGKVTEIDGVEIKLPVDWNYAHYKQSDFRGNNWEGDDAYRGIGMFNCNESLFVGDKEKGGYTKEEKAAMDNSYSVNVRWEYCGYGYTDPGQYKTQGGYKATAASIPDMVVGGTTAECCEGSGNSRHIKNQENIKNIGEYLKALRKAKIMIVNPENGKACVCGPGLVPGGISEDVNWGGDPLFGLGGISEAASAALIGKEDLRGDALTNDPDWGKLQPHTGDDNIALELFFVDENAPYGPCEFDGSLIKGKNKDNCKKSNVDNSDAANLAVSVSFDEDNPKYRDHEMIEKNTGSDTVSVCPTTKKAMDLRKLATGDTMTADCGYFVASVVIMTLDKNYPTGYTVAQIGYMEGEGKKKWKYLGEHTYTEWFNSGKAEPGDVIINNSHTVLWVGYDAIKAQYDKINDKSYCIVGASQDSHGPKLEQHTYGNGGKYKVFRFEGDPDPSEKADRLSEIGL